MKSIIEIDYNLLKEYRKFSDVNDNWTIASYLNTFYCTNDAIAFSKLFFPDFELIDNCVILSMRYDKNIFESWKNEFNGEVSLIEKMCNLYEISDYFHINDDISEDNYESLILQLGEILKKSIEINLQLLFPNRQFKIYIFNEYGSSFITFHSINNNPE